MAFTSASTSPLRTPSLNVALHPQTVARPDACLSPTSPARDTETIKIKIDERAHHTIPPPVATLSPGVGRGLWLVIALTIIARARRSDGMRPCWCICVVGFGGRQIFRQTSRFVVKRGGLSTSSSACSGFAGPRAQVGLAFFAKISRGVPEVPFWRG